MDYITAIVGPGKATIAMVGTVNFVDEEGIHCGQYDLADMGEFEVEIKHLSMTVDSGTQVGIRFSAYIPATSEICGML